VIQPTTEPLTVKEGPPGAYYLLPAADSEDGTPVIDNLHRWLDKGLWGLGQRTGYRKSFAPGDRLCFYAVRIGVVTECMVDSPSFELSRRENPSTVEVTYAIRLRGVRWFKEPVELTADLRSQLSAFQGRDPSKGWAWFVQGTSKLTEDDFHLLTGRMVTSERRTTFSPKPKRRGPRSTLVSISEDYKGKTVRAIVFQNRRHKVSTWKDAAFCLFELLRRADPNKFEATALTLKGRKRPYVTHDRAALRVPQLIPNTSSLYFETNLGANSIAKLCYTLIARMGHSEADLAFETQQ
jgi:hypothetical protein